MACYLLFTLFLVTLLSVSTDAKWKDFCDGSIKVHSNGALDCCKVHRDQYKLNVGECGSNIGRSMAAVGFNRQYPTEVKEEDAVSDSDSTEDKPGADEGGCHVQRLKVNRKMSCLPGNMVQVARKLHDALGDSGKCFMDFNENCRIPLKKENAYRFAIRVKIKDNSFGAGKIRNALEGHGCQYQENDSYVFCPL